MTPLHIQLLLHCHAICEPIKGDTATKGQYLIDLEQSGLIKPDEEAAGRPTSGWVTTERGRAHIEQMLALPLPVMVWADFQGRPIKLTN